MRRMLAVATSGCLAACGTPSASTSQFVGGGDADTACGGRREPITVAVASMISDLKVDTTGVYFAQQTVQEPAPIYQAPLCGGTSTLLGTVGDLVDACGSNAWVGARLALSDTDVYFLGAQGLGRVAKSGGEPTLLAPTECGWFSAGLVSSDAVALWMQYPSDGPAVLYRLAESGVSAAAVATGLGLGPTTPSAADASNYYWPSAPGSVSRVPVAGGSPDVVATDTSGRPVAGIAIDSTYIYYSLSGACSNPVEGPSCPSPSPTAGAIMRIPIVGGTAMTLATDWDASGIAVDSQNVYWVDPYRAVMWASLGQDVSAAGEAHTLAADAEVSVGPVLGDGAVFWVSSGGVARIAVPQ
jgi:hypothetical protein